MPLMTENKVAQFVGIKYLRIERPRRDTVLSEGRGKRRRPPDHPCPQTSR
jgi:hypothetical protein